MSQSLNPYERFDAPAAPNPYTQFDEAPAPAAPRRRGPTRATRAPEAQYEDQGQQVRAPLQAPTLIGQVSDFLSGENRREQGVGEVMLQPTPARPIADIDRDSENRSLLGRVVDAAEAFNPWNIAGPLLARGSPVRQMLPAEARQALDANDRSQATARGFILDRNERSRAEIIAQQHPQAEFRRDQYGNLQARLSPNQPWAYINRPGASVQDAADLVVDAAMLSPAARGARAVGVIGAPIRTVAARAGTAAVLGGATEAARQGVATLEGGRGPQAGDVVRTGVAMGIAQPIDDLLSATGQALGDLNQAVPGRANQNWTGGQQRAEDAARSLGAGQTAAAQRSVTPDRDAARQAYEAADEFGVPLTRGEARGNARARQNEDAMLQGSSTEDAQRIMGGFRDRQTEALRQGGMGIATRGRQPLTGNLEEAGTEFAAQITQRRARLEALNDRAYADAFSRARSERVPPTDELLARVDAVIDERFLEAGPARSIIARLQGMIARGQATYATVERARQQINNLLGTAMNSADDAASYAIGSIKSELDDWVQATMSLSSPARAAMQEARGIHQELRSLYASGGPRDLGGRTIERAMDIERTGTQIAESILGRGNQPPAAALQTLERVRQMATQTRRDGRLAQRPGATRGARAFNDPAAQPPPEMQALREAVFYRILAPLEARASGGVVPAQTLVTNLERAVDGPGQAIMRQMFADWEIAAIRRYLGVTRRLTRPVGVNNSGTAPALSRMAQQAFDGLVAVMFGGANVATLGVAGAVRQANRQLSATLAADAATTRPGLNIQLPRRFAANTPPLAPLIAAEERLRETEMRGTAPDEISPEAQQQDALIDDGQVTTAADGTITFPADGRWITLEIGDMSPPRALQAWASGALQPIGEYATEAEAHAAAQGRR